MKRTVDRTKGVPSKTQREIRKIEREVGSHALRLQRSPRIKSTCPTCEALPNHRCFTLWIDDEGTVVARSFTRGFHAARKAPKADAERAAVPGRNTRDADRKKLYEREVAAADRVTVHRARYVASRDAADIDAEQWRGHHAKWRIT